MSIYYEYVFSIMLKCFLVLFLIYKPFIKANKYFEVSKKYWSKQDCGYCKR